MKLYKVIHKNSGKVLVGKVKLAKSFFSRLKGLMFDHFIEEDEGLLLSPCNSIHTCFMNFPIDVIFLDKKNGVVKVIENLRPWKITRMYFSSVKVLELKAGLLRGQIKEGDELEVVCLN